VSCSLAQACGCSHVVLLPVLAAAWRTSGAMYQGVPSRPRSVRGSWAGSKNTARPKSGGKQVQAGRVGNGVWQAMLMVRGSLLSQCWAWGGLVLYSSCQGLYVCGGRQQRAHIWVQLHVSYTHMVMQQAKQGTKVSLTCWERLCWHNHN
jgi:hypothetical protein